MDNSITERPTAFQKRERTTAEKEALLAFHPSTKHLPIAMFDTPHSGQTAAIGYHPGQQTLCVRFKFGHSEYHYHRVEPEVAEAFAAAPSKGGFLKEHIKGVYHYEQTRLKDEKRA